MLHIDAMFAIYCEISIYRYDGIDGGNLIGTYFYNHNREHDFGANIALPYKIVFRMAPEIRCRIIFLVIHIDIAPQRFFTIYHNLII
jgi:hypothetical protein